VPYDDVDIDERLRVERISSAEDGALVDPLFREYGRWVADQLLAHHDLCLSESDRTRHIRAPQPSAFPVPKHQ
jgi:hypothetical protein